MNLHPNFSVTFSLEFLVNRRVHSSLNVHHLNPDTYCTYYLNIDTVSLRNGRSHIARLEAAEQVAGHLLVCMRIIQKSEIFKRITLRPELVQKALNLT